MYTWVTTKTFQLELEVEDLCHLIEIRVLFSPCRRARGGLLHHPTQTATKHIIIVKCEAVVILDAK